jgi:DNA-binding CsgD family transcriptional regulator
MNLAKRIILTPREEEILTRWSCGKSFPLRLNQRARIILLATQGVYNHEIDKRLGISRPTVQLWRERFLALRIPGLEQDAPRPGRFPKISQLKITTIVNATLHPLSKLFIQKTTFLLC